MAAKEEQKIPVIEIFGPTIQGEGSVIGRRTHFIRFGGCDYKCVRCDSMHAVDGDLIKQYATYMTQEEVYEALCKAMGDADRMVTFSGGNPALWELGSLVDWLHAAGIAVAIETQGTYYKPWIAKCDVITISPKGPGMGEKFLPEEFGTYMSKLRHHKGLCIKVVVFSAQDLEFAIEVQEICHDMHLAPPFYLSLGNSHPPLTTAALEPDELKLGLLKDAAIMAEEILSNEHCKNMIFLPQWHVLLWGNKQGV